MAFSRSPVFRFSAKMVSVSHNTESEEDASTLTNVFVKTLKPSRLLGLAPLRLVEADQELHFNKNFCSYKFVFKWYSLSSLYSLFFQLIYVLASLVIMFEVSSGYSKVARVLSPEFLLGITLSSLESSFTETILVSYFLQFYAVGIALYLSTFRTAPTGDFVKPMANN